MAHQRITITLPVFDNDGLGIPHVHDELQEYLLQVFGGFTQTQANGAWVCPDTGKIYRDENTIYSVVAEVKGNGIIGGFTLKMARIAREARQECIMVTYEPHVGVDFIKPLDL